MSYFRYASLLSFLIILVACTDGEEQDTEIPDESEEAEETVEHDEQAVDILNEAISFYDDLSGLYVEREHIIDVEDGGRQAFEYEWMYALEDDEPQQFRHEVHHFDQLNQEDDEEATVQVTFTNLEQDGYIVEYTSDTNEGFTYPNRQARDTYLAVPMYEHALEHAQLSYGGEEEVGDYNTHHIIVTEDQHRTHYWFDQETFFEVQSQYEYNAENESDDEVQNLNDGRRVVDYTVDPEFDESLFEVPSNVTIEQQEE
ncbi:hypothetical protein [Geomicrobium sp. JCM 19038]|uniref:hypothetical protein n=1 Tax=Geomicrobium sp. JCM 19038 TaxID=1460635 RepID=UPI00045F4151|nr:hypothetical protein [Geomicrobium sp. JCM 19038]GAK10218.1 hypothetical protein JCM19038_4106 [Geomicrobium sp. JCM 19038]